MEPAVRPVLPTAPGSIRRGTSTLAPRVVEKIAAVAAASVPPVGAPPRRAVRWLARWRRASRGSHRWRSDHHVSPKVGRSSFVAPPEAPVPGALSGAMADSGGLPAVSARLGGGTVRLALSMSVAYPASLLEVAGEVRERIRDRVAALTGLQVTSIEINVSALVAPEGSLGGSSGRDGHA